MGAARYVQKCACSVPIYRLEKQFNWLGIPMSRSTMTDLFHMAAEKLRPLYQRLLQGVPNAHIVLADETTLTMQERGKREPLLDQADEYAQGRPCRPDR